MPTFKLALLAVPILAVDAATFSNVYEAYRFFEHPEQAFLVAVAFAVLQIGCLVLFSQTLPTSTRRWLFVGAAVLLGVTGLANISMAFIRAEPILPAKALTAVFGGSPAQLLVALSWIFGLALVVAGLIFWTAFGTYLRNSREEKTKRLEALARFDAALSENGSGDKEQVKEALREQHQEHQVETNGGPEPEADVAS